MKKMLLMAIVAAAAVSVSFGDCDKTCLYECKRIKNEQQKAECFVGCGYDEIGAACIKDFEQKFEIDFERQSAKVFTNDN